MKRVEILNFNSLGSFNELSTVNTITVIPLRFWKSATSVVVKHQLEVLTFVENTAETNLDNVELVGQYTIDTAGSLIFIVDKDKVTTACEAREYIAGLIVEYLTNDLHYTSTGATSLTYDLIVERACDGRFVTAYKQITLGDLVKVIPGLDSSLDVNLTGGYVYKIYRTLSDCKGRTNA